MPSTLESAVKTTAAWLAVLSILDLVSEAFTNFFRIAKFIRDAVTIATAVGSLALLASATGKAYVKNDRTKVGSTTVGARDVQRGRVATAVAVIILAAATLLGRAYMLVRPMMRCHQDKPSWTGAVASSYGPSRGGRAPPGWVCTTDPTPWWAIITGTRDNHPLAGLPVLTSAWVFLLVTHLPLVQTYVWNSTPSGVSAVKQAGLAALSVLAPPAAGVSLSPALPDAEAPRRSIGLTIWTAVKLFVRWPVAYTPAFLGLLGNGHPIPVELVGDVLRIMYWVCSASCIAATYVTAVVVLVTDDRTPVRRRAGGACSTLFATMFLPTEGTWRTARVADSKADAAEPSAAAVDAAVAEDSEGFVPSIQRNYDLTRTVVYGLALGAAMPLMYGSYFWFFENIFSEDLLTVFASGFIIYTSRCIPQVNRFFWREDAETGPSEDIE